MIDGDILTGTSFFIKFTPEDIAVMAEKLSVRTVAKNDTIIKQGEAAGELFLVKQGQSKMLLDLGAGHDLSLNYIRQNECFGEMVILNESTSSVTVVAEKDVELFVLDRNSFLDIIENHPGTALVLLKAIGRSLSIRLRLLNIGFSSIPESRRTLPADDSDVIRAKDVEREMFNLLGKIGDLMTVPTGEAIIKEYGFDRDLFVIEGGTVEITKSLHGEGRISLAVLGPGHVLGEMSFFDKQYRSAEVRARETVTACIIRKNHIQDLAGTDLSQLNRIFLAILRNLSLKLRLTIKHYLSTE